MERTYTCEDCGAAATAGARGPLPKRCDPCRVARHVALDRSHRRERGAVARGTEEYRAMRSADQARIWRTSRAAERRSA